jgi:citrate/tricarballylate utilization protein
MGAVYRRNGLLLALALALGLGLFLLLAAARTGSLSAVPAQGNFYAVFPHGLMVAMFLPVFAFVIIALALGLRRFWRDQAPAADPVDTGAAAREATGNVLALTYLDGGHGEGCHNEDDRWTQKRRWMHHLTFYGFMLCFAATSLGTIYHYALGWVAPYDLPSLPKLLGALGGIGLLVGPAGLFWLHLRRHPEHGDAAQRPMDLGFIALLLLTSLTGLGLWAARGVPGQTVWLVLHLGAVMALFITLPYGKFAHGVYRCAALLKFAIERRQPDRLRLGGD